MRPGFHTVRDNARDQFRRAYYAPNNKFRARGGDNRRVCSLDYRENYGDACVRYCDNGIHGDDAPSLTFSERVFFPHWPVA